MRLIIRALQEEDDQQYGHGFNDAADDFVPGVVYNDRRRRNSSVSSDDSETGVNNRVRTGSISERVAGMQVITKPEDKKKSKFEIGDIENYSLLF